MKRRKFLGQLAALAGVSGAAGAVNVEARAEPTPPLFLIETHVAGLAYYQAMTALSDLAPGQSLILRREPTNPHDELAIEVFRGDLKLGYVPRFRNPVLARLMDADKPLVAEVASVVHLGEAPTRPRAYGPEVRFRIVLRDG